MVTRLLDGYSVRNSRLKDKGVAHLIECSDPALAALIANGTRARKFCFLTCDRYLMVPMEHGKAFRKAVQQTDYVLPL